MSPLGFSFSPQAKTEHARKEPTTTTYRKCNMNAPFSTTDVRTTAPSFPNEGVGCKRMMRKFIGGRAETV